MKDQENIEREIIRLRKKGLRNHEIQGRIGLTESVLEEIITSLIYDGKLTRQTAADIRRIQTENRAEQITKLRQEGCTNAEIAEKVGLKEQSVYEYVWKLDLKRRRPHSPRSIRHEWESSEEQEIAEMRRKKHPVSEIAKKFRLSSRDVQFILRKERLRLKRKRIQFIAHCRESGFTLKEIGKALGVSTPYVQKVSSEI